MRSEAAGLLFFGRRSGPLELADPVIGSLARDAEDAVEAAANDEVMNLLPG